MLYEKIQEDVKTAMRARDAARLEALRFLVSEIKNVGINERKEITDAIVTGVLQKLAKQRREGIDQFRASGRADLVAKEEAELAVLQGYLPKQLSDADLEAIVKTAIADSGAASKKDMGKVMKLAMERAAGGADGKRVQAIVQKLLP